MVNSIHKRMIDSVRPYPLCQELIGGAVEKRMDGLVEYLSTQFRETFKPDNKSGLVFVKLEELSPAAAARYIASRRTPQPYDIARSDFYLCMMHFTYKGNPLTPLPILLPFATEGNIIYFSGSPYIARMVLSDKTLSPGNNDIFQRVYRGKARIISVEHKVAYDYLDSNNVTRTREQTGEALTCNYYSPDLKADLMITRSKPTLLLYLLTKYGYKQTMLLLLGVVPTVVDNEEGVKEAIAEGQLYFHTALSAGNPNEVKKMVGRNHPICTTTLGFLLPKDVVVSKNLKKANQAVNVMASLFYILDGLPLTPMEYFTDDQYWQISLQDTLYGAIDNQRKNSQLDAHLETIGNYVDQNVLNDLEREFAGTLNQDFTEDGLYKLMIVMIERFSVWSNAASLISASVVDKRLRLFYYMFIDIITQMNVLSFAVNNPKNQNVSDARILEIIRGEINIGRMYKIRGSTGKGGLKKNQSVKSLSGNVGDHRYFKATADLELQVNVGEAMSNKMDSNIGDPTTLLDHGQCVAGTINAINKSTLSPVKYMNCYLPYDENTGTIRFDEQIRKDLAHLKMVLARTARRPATITLPPEFDIYKDDI